MLVENFDSGSSSSDTGGRPTVLHKNCDKAIGQNIRETGVTIP